MTLVGWWSTRPWKKRSALTATMMEPTASFLILLDGDLEVCFYEIMSAGMITKSLRALDHGTAFEC
jgi:hypothetical protein